MAGGTPVDSASPARRERSGDIPGHWRTARCSRFLGAELGEGKEEEPEYGDPCGRYRSGEHAANPVLVVKQRQGARLCYSDAGPQHKSEENEFGPPCRRAVDDEGRTSVGAVARAGIKSHRRHEPEDEQEEEHQAEP